MIAKKIYSYVYGDFRCHNCRFPYILSKENQCITCQRIAEIGGNACYGDKCDLSRFNGYQCYLCIGHQEVCNNK